MINMNVIHIIHKFLPTRDNFYFPIDVFQPIVGSFSQGETDFLVTCNPSAGEFYASLCCNMISWFLVLISEEPGSVLIILRL